MTATHEKYWEALDEASRASRWVPFRRAIHSILDAIEFDALYFLAPVVADRRIGRVVWNIGFPRELEALYKKAGWKNDPLPDIALNRTNAFRFSDAPRLTKLDNRQRAFLEQLGEGVAVHCTGPYARAGFVGVARPKNPDLDDALVRKVQVAAQLCFQRYCEIAGSHYEQPPDLSQRELDVIRWIGEGKSNAVIADILGITKNSVDSYVKRIFAKLGVSDRTAAAVRAVALGLIATGKHSKQAAHRVRWKT
ncbi:helix-turn-helix transcriptional regulator [Altererythrobacter sp.]|uniref:helix-turn-helix transcriptional regulator n=1 Tax=Altererythrobacter sp. TaxID=1872480 RepID=UPI003D0E3609